jgi:hypothetical protein
LELRTGRDRDRDPRNDLGDFLVVAELAPIRPQPAMKYQTSSTVRWATAFDTVFGASRKAAMPPRDSMPSTRTSEPSGAIASGVAAMLRVSNVIGLAQSSWPTQFTPRMARQSRC